MCVCHGRSTGPLEADELWFTALMGAVFALVVGGAGPIWVPAIASPAAALLCPGEAQTANRSWTDSRGGKTNWRLVCEGVPDDAQPSEFVSAAVSSLVLLPLGVALAFGVRALFRWAETPD